MYTISLNDSCAFSFLPQHVHFFIAPFSFLHTSAISLFNESSRSGDLIFFSYIRKLSEWKKINENNRFLCCYLYPNSRSDTSKYSIIVRFMHFLTRFFRKSQQIYCKISSFTLYTIDFAWDHKHLTMEMPWTTRTISTSTFIPYRWRVVIQLCRHHKERFCPNISQNCNVMYS